MRYVIVAGEASGDILGASLIQALRAQQPQAQFEGIGGPLMIAQGFNSHVPMDRLSVMGLVEVLGRLPELLRIRRQLREYCLRQPPTAFIGIDSPDFNLPLARQLKQVGIKTVHYVSPSVWAWRQKRIFKIKQSVDLMLTLFPFESRIYQQHRIPVECVGHTLADDIPLQTDRQQAREQLQLSQAKGPVFAVLPGSRGGEVSRLAPLFIATIGLVQQQYPTATFVIPAANADRRQQIETLLQEHHQTAMIVDGHSRDVMIAADAVLLASGTAALEAMLVKRPMVVAYRFSALTYAIMSRMIKVPYISLPNLLADAALVPELVQDAATPSALAESLIKTWQGFEQQPHILQTFDDLHQLLRKNAATTAAQAIIQLTESSPLEPNL